MLKKQLCEVKLTWNFSKNVRTDNTMAKRKTTKGQTTIYKTWT